jgi:hypothetical protein
MEPFLKSGSAYVQVRVKNLSGYPWVGQNTGERGTKWERL